MSFHLPAHKNVAAPAGQVSGAPIAKAPRKSVAKGVRVFHDADLDIEVRQVARDRFTVQYGKQVRSFDYAGAARDLGLCLFHALACEGILDKYTFHSPTHPE